MRPGVSGGVNAESIVMLSQPDAGPTLDLTQCEWEPIHIPNAIQPHGAFIAASVAGFRVTHASANLEQFFGLAPEAVFGRTLNELLGEQACRMLRSIMACSRIVAATDKTPGSGQTLTVVAPHGDTVHLNVHQTATHVCLDIEPLPATSVPSVDEGLIEAVLESFTHATTPDDLCELAVRGLKRIIGFDRVMAYQFHEDGHGEVIAEACEPDMDPYFGLHYPAGDFPPQARRLYQRHRVGTIPDIAYTPVPIRADPTTDANAPLDLSMSDVRSVSPIHRQYLRNMGVQACMTAALVQRPDMPSQVMSDGQRLWGMFVCHHRTPRVVDPGLRASFSLVAQVVSLLLRSLAEAEAHAERETRNAHLATVVDRLAKPQLLQADLAAVEGTLLRMVVATGAFIRIGATGLCLGRTPPLHRAERAMDILLPGAGGMVRAVDDMGRRHPELADCIADGSGALLLPLGRNKDDAILWFRPERARTVRWGGNPDEHVLKNPLTGQLSPRVSFAEWRQTVRGRSTPWTEADRTIAQALHAAVETAIAERTKAELDRLRYYDPLTGLPNRSLLQERLQTVTADAKAALLFLDIDRFKAVNDTMGHAAGDTLLIEVARRLRLTAGPDHLAARLGGDEFVVLFEGLDRSAVARLGEAIRLAVEAPFHIDGRPCYVSASIGIAIADQTNGLDLVRAADMAMYSAKQSGGNRELVFEPALFDHAIMQFELEQDMREALSRGDQFVLLYQPLFKVVDGTRLLEGFEALVRWRHPRQGWMSPALFIPLAEKSGLILPLGDWVLATALRQGLAFRKTHPNADLVINVNISALQLPQPDFVANVVGALQAEGFPPPALCLEVTESMLTDASAAAVLSEVRKHGIKVAIDDFGVGYSSLSYLRRLPVDIVKLDRSFMDDVVGDPRGEGFVGAVIALAHAAGKPVVFEGIETQAQVDIAAAAGADVMQGFFFAPPLSASSAEALAAQHSQLDCLAKPKPATPP